MAAQAADPGRRFQVRVEGRVQGVGFRWYTRDRAVALGLTGWVRNLPDGAVAAVAEGPAHDLAAWLEQVRRGPPAGRVQRCVVEVEAPATGEYGSFAIER